MRKIKTVNDFKYLVYADFGKGLELAAWYDVYKDAEKEAKFLESKGRKTEIIENNR